MSLRPVASCTEGASLAPLILPPPPGPGPAPTAAPKRAACVALQLLAAPGPEPLFSPWSL